MSIITEGAQEWTAQKWALSALVVVCSVFNEEEEKKKKKGLYISGMLALSEVCSVGWIEGTVSGLT